MKMSRGVSKKKKLNEFIFNIVKMESKELAVSNLSRLLYTHQLDPFMQSRLQVSK